MPSSTQLTRTRRPPEASNLYGEPKRKGILGRGKSGAFKLGHAMHLDHVLGGHALEKERQQREAESWLLREELYALSSVVGRMQMENELDELQALIQSWTDSEEGERKRRVAHHIEQKYAHDCCLVVTDMSGFTRITREEGVLHFLMLIKEMQAMCLPIMNRYGGKLVKTEADDLFVIFQVYGMHPMHVLRVCTCASS